MSAARPEAQLMLAALASAARLATHRQGQQHSRAIEEMRHGALTHLVEAVVNRRVDAVKQGFGIVLAQYADQARHYMDQQRDYADRELDSSDPLRRLELRARINDLDTALAAIRAEAGMAYAHMTEVIRAIGASPRDFAQQYAEPLALPSASHEEAPSWD